MKQQIVITLFAIAAASVAQAHFVFVVPDEGGQSAKVIMSETLQPDSQVDVGLIGGTKLSIRDSNNDETPLSIERAGDIYTTPLPGSGARLIHGFTDLGIMSRSKVHLLLYYPKTILGDAFDPKARVGKTAVVEIIPVGRPGDFTLQLLGRGQPQPESEITVILPDGSEKVVKTDASGHTEKFTETGRYGAWARFWEDEAGERNGTKYEQVRHYAMIVFDAKVPAAQSESEPSVTASHFATMPEATSSFGAVATGGWLYVYGGHISPTHVYSTEAVSGRFHRMRLSGEPVWEELAGGPGLQGMNITAHGGMIYRIGGMAPQNKRGKASDNRSVADCARFNPETGQWHALPSLPEPRSSHDVLALGDKLLVVGGWTMTANGQEWRDNFLALDLSAKKPVWESFPQPFRRRALMAAAYEGKLYVIGGFSEQNKVMRNVSIYDPQSEAWSEGPQLPEGPTSGFAPAVGVHLGSLYVSVADGSLFRLDKSGRSWEKAGSGTPRLAHRLASKGETVLVIGGAADGNNFDLIEAVPVGGGSRSGRPFRNEKLLADR